MMNVQLNEKILKKLYYIFYNILPFLLFLGMYYYNNIYERKLDNYLKTLIIQKSISIISLIYIISLTIFTSFLLFNKKSREQLYNMLNKEGKRKVLSFLFFGIIFILRLSTITIDYNSIDHVIKTYDGQCKIRHSTIGRVHFDTYIFIGEDDVQYQSLDSILAKYDSEKENRGIKKCNIRSIKFNYLAGSKRILTDTIIPK